jgi:hypothetical protein
VSDPILLTTCEHMFCSGCINRVHVCPLDQMPFSDSDKKPPLRMIRARIEESRVKCNACGSEMKRGLSGEFFIRHCEEECPQPCSNSGCNWRGPFNKVTEHLNRECQFIACENSACAFTGSLSENQKHLYSECNFATVSCPHGCNAPLLRKDIEAHSSKCPVVLKEQEEKERATLAAIEAAHRHLLDELNPSSEDIIQLSVSGHPISFAKSALEKAKGSLLYSLFNGSRPSKRDSAGVVFVSRPFLPFSIVVEWLQSGVVPTALPPGLDSFCFYSEVAFWKIDALFSLIKYTVFVTKQLDGCNFEGRTLNKFHFRGSAMSFTRF